MTNLVFIINQKESLEMTQKEKILLLKETIEFLYEKEGRNISYIAKLLNVDKGNLSKQIRVWDLTKGNSKHITPSTRKFINRNKDKIISMLRNNISITQIAEELSATADKIYYVINVDSDLKKEKEFCDSLKINSLKSQKKKEYEIEDLPGEEWKEILGYDKYYASNKGRIKKYLKEYDCYKILKPTPNSRTGRMYISLINNEGKRKNLVLARVIAHMFCDGYKENFTVDHLDGNFLNNNSENLQWVTQSENNKRAYVNGRKPNKAYSTFKFDKIILNDKYEFKTIAALSRFLEKSETQIRRYITKECATEHKIELINNKCNDYPVKE